MAFQLKNLEINSDILEYLPQSNPNVILFNEVADKFGGNSLAMVALETDDVFNQNTINRIDIITQKFKEMPEVSYVTSLTNVLDIKDDGYDGIEIGRLIDEYELPETTEELLKIKNYTLSKDMYRGRLVSDDSKTTLIICRLSDDIDKIQTAAEIKEIVEKKNLKEKARYGGLPFQMSELSEIMINDLKLLIPLIGALIVLSLFFSFRTLRGVILPLLSVAISTVWTLGIMSLLKIPFTAISDIIPVILIAVGSAYSIHVINKFDEDVTSNDDRINQSKKALSQIITPVILAAVTTMAGFIAFVFGSYLTMIQEFGIFSGLGVLFALIVSVTFVPSVLSLLPVKNKILSVNGEIEKKGITLFMDKIGNFVLKNEKAIIFGGIIIVIVCALNIPKIERKVDMLDYFQKDSNIRLTEEMMEEKFGGSIPIQILVKGDIQDPTVLKEMKKLEDFLEAQGDAQNPQSVADLIEEMNDVLGDGKVIPDTREKIANLWFLLEGEDVMSQLVNYDKTEAVIQATIVTIDSKRLRRLVVDIEEYIKEMDASEFTFTQTGMHKIYNHLDESIVKSQMQSLIIALILVFLFLLFQMHSFSGGLIGLIPILFSLLVIFGVMGIVGIPLDIATVLVGSISIGIGIDYSIHFVNRFRKEFKRNETTIAALDKTLETTGKAILINVITVMLGFLVLVMANLIPLRRFGVLVAITMIGSGIGAITLLPAIILITKANFVGDWSNITNGMRAKANSAIKKTKSKMKK